MNRARLKWKLRSRAIFLHKIAHIVAQCTTGQNQIAQLTPLNPDYDETYIYEHDHCHQPSHPLPSHTNLLSPSSFPPIFIANHNP
jgi:hypothetical protein